jgi:hypothetical protein
MSIKYHNTYNVSEMFVMYNQYGGTENIFTKEPIAQYNRFIDSIKKEYNHKIKHIMFDVIETRVETTCDICKLFSRCDKIKVYIEY